MKQANAKFAVKSWDEKPYRELADGAKFAQVSAVFTYEGDIEGESSEDYLMFYRADGSGNYVGLARFEGSVEGRRGSFALQISGTFDAVGVNASWFVVPNSGTGDLQGLTGQCTVYLADHGPYPIVFEYDLA